MKTPRSLVPALCASALLLSQPLRAFDNEPESTEPDLSLVFPLEQRGEQVVNSEDVLINPGCIIPAGSVFLTIFVPPRPEDVDVVKKKEKSNQEYAYSRSVQLPDKKDNLSPAQRAAYERATRDPWKNHMVYRAAMKQYRFDEMRLVFIPKGSDQSALEAFNLPEGLFLSGEGNGIKILAVQKDSPAHKEGLVAGGTVIKVNGQPLSNLAQFQKVYYAEKKISHDAGKPVELTVQMPGGAGTKTVVFAAPRKLLLNDFFSASDVEKDPVKKPEPPATPDRTAPSPLAP